MLKRDLHECNVFLRNSRSLSNEKFSPKNDLTIFIFNFNLLYIITYIYDVDKKPWVNQMPLDQLLFGQNEI